MKRNGKKHRSGATPLPSKDGGKTRLYDEHRMVTIHDLPRYTDNWVEIERVVRPVATTQTTHRQSKGE